MRISICLLIAVTGLALLGGSVHGVERSDLADLTYSELIGYGIISAYSTNVLIQIGFQGGSLPKADAQEAIGRNLAFVKVLERYSFSLKRTTSTKDDGTKALIGAMCEVSTYLGQQTQALRDWVANPESKSAKQLYDAYCDRLEKKIELMLVGPQTTPAP